MRLAPLRMVDRPRVSELLIATAAFSSEEVGVALELFDLCHPAGAKRVSGTTIPTPWPATSATTADPDTRSLRSLLRDDTPADYEFIGAYDDDRLIGYACFGPTPATDGTFDLYWLAVDPAAQGRGAGRALVKAVEQELARRGGRLLVVETSSRADYASTREFYARGGYGEAARVRDFYAPADDRIILTTRLTSQEGGVATR